MNSLKLLPSSWQANSDCNSRIKPLQNKSFSVSSTQLVWAARVQKDKAYSAAGFLPCERVSSWSPAFLPSAECSNTSGNCWRNVSKVGKAEPSILQTAVAHSNTFPVSNEQTKTMRLESVRYSEGCWLTKSKHCFRKPLHLADSPSNFSGKASRGFIEGTWAGRELLQFRAMIHLALAVLWPAPRSGWWVDLTGVGARWVVKLVQIARLIVAWALLDRCLAKSSVTKSQRSLDPFKVLLRIVRKYRVRHRKGRTVQARQRQSWTPGERSEQEANNHSPINPIQVGAGSKQSE